MEKNNSKSTTSGKKQKVEAGRNWYAIHTYSGYEAAVARNLKQRVESLGKENEIFNIVVPTEKKIKIQGGKRKTVEEKVYPGYVLVDMIVTDDSWYVVRNTPRVTGFVGSGTTPVPLEQDEVDKLLGHMREEEPEFTVEFQIDEVVRITDGPFKEFEGKVSDIDKARGKMKVLVSIFGRETPVEIDFLQAKSL